MFRNPRSNSPSTSSSLSQSIGRPPTPPESVHQKILRTASSASPAMATPATTPVLGRGKTTPMRSSSRNLSAPIVGSSTSGKVKNKGNGNIMNFFAKAEPTTPQDKAGGDGGESLFLDDEDFRVGTVVQGPTPPKEAWDPAQSGGEESGMSRYNEHGGFVKKRKVEDLGVRAPSLIRMKSSNQRSIANDTLSSDKGNDLMEASDSSLSKGQGIHGIAANGVTEDLDAPELLENHRSTTVNTAIDGTEHDPDKTVTVPLPPLKREPTSYGEGIDFDGIEDFDDEFPEEGEEYMERRWMAEQAELEMGLEEEDEMQLQASVAKEEECERNIATQGPAAASCPICGIAMIGVTDQEASKHVNDCLDGKPSALPTSAKAGSSPPIKKENSVPSHKRFQRAAIARPGQENPFGLAQNGEKSSSAFSTLMSGHAEDAAWATAAASEVASRGKPAYQRTCPFYKILPGFSICVDAFRYGAVEGCKAYFLSHFHSDHYIGLTSSWCHGPIYCSHVTANLVRQQLKVDPKWVFDLDFEKRMEVPETGGVHVTMIPANHCPGSSLFLYEKAMGKGKNPKVHRVLHCGDFRACPAHVQHPLLRPDIMDAVTGKSKHQTIDVCYLDTTYLTPKYAFPSQETVIKSCAEMCVSLSKDFIDEDDDWEQTKRERAGSGMVKFVRKESDVKNEEETEEPGLASTAETPIKKKRGRLLVIVGTYSIGKERICLGVARALNSKIYAPPQKQRVVAALEDPELSARMTTDPLEAQVHMQMLMEIRAETLADYLTTYKPHFSRIVGFRPSGWNYRPPNSRFTESPSVQTVLHGENWKSKYSMRELVPQRGSTRESSCFGVPYSEHSSFRELSMFCCALRIEKIIPTVNVGSAKSREKMKGWIEKWAVERKKNGLFKVEDGVDSW
ncbi:MAG: hypothetical protein Q9191_003162 [Dirinaria sp. TL-2023a]